jgi:condensin complex subunit 1
MKVTVGRLEDKSALVRKQAIHLIKSFLERNPFAAKLSIEELELRHEEKNKELTDFRAKINEEANKMDEVNVKSNEILAEMKPYIIKCLMQESIEEENITADECNELLKEFGQLVEAKKYKRLLLLIRKAEELNGNWKTVQTFEKEAAHLYIESLIKSYYLLQTNCKDFEEEYKKAENAVRFLEDSLEFSRLVVNAVPKLQELLMSKTDSDSTEAINFFTAAFLFGIKNTEGGMRQMLYLVWSTAKDKREPVREAYRNVLLKTDHGGR